MIELLILIVLALAVLAGIGLALLPRRRLNRGTQRFKLSEPPATSLFDTEISPDPPEPSLYYQALLDRAAAGDQSTLEEARALRDVRLYAGVLDALIERASSCQQDFDSLVRRILENDDLQTSAKLAERVMEQ